MPSTLQSANTANNSIITSSVAQAPATNTSSWPSLEHNSNNLNHGTTANTSLDIQQPPKPKTFASVAASKKTQPPPPLPPPMMVMQQFNDIKPSSNAVYESSQVNKKCIRFVQIFVRSNNSKIVSFNIDNLPIMILCFWM